jgi:6,7-dimethyl-8-ribityllumazine synthase
MGVNQRPEGAESPELDGSGLRIAIVAGRFNDTITLRLLEGARRAAAALSVAEEDITLEWVPGAFEIPFAAKTVASSGKVDAVVCVGAVIRGETTHYDFVAGECARGIQDVQLEVGVPVIFGVLTTENVAQALARSEGEGGHNVGAECVETAVEMSVLRGRWA